MAKNPPANAGDACSIPGSGRSPGEGNGNPHRFSRLGNPMDRGARRAIVHGVARVRHDLVTEQLQPVVGTQHFHCRGQFQSLLGELRSPKPHSAAKRKGKEREASFPKF